MRRSVEARMLLTVAGFLFFVAVVIVLYLAIDGSKARVPESLTKVRMDSIINTIALPVKVDTQGFGELARIANDLDRARMELYRLSPMEREKELIRYRAEMEAIYNVQQRR